MLQFAATHCAFAAIVIVLLLVACVQSKTSSKEGSYRRTINAINVVSTRSLLLFWLMGSNDLTVQGRLLLQVLTLSMVSLTKSCLHAIDCTEDAELGHATLDAMPDVLCDWQSRSFKMQKGLAITLMFIYDLLVPWGLFSVLALAQDSGHINEPEFLQAHGWYLQKYHADAWYAELVFVFYRIAMSSCAVLLSSRANASLCLALMGLVTAAMLAFVLSVKPFNDNEDDRPSEEAMTSADRKQAWALGATVAATLVGFGCAQTKDRGEGMDAAIAALITCIGAAPILAGLYEKYKDHKANKAIPPRRAGEFRPGDIVDVDTGDGMECGATVLGLSEGGDKSSPKCECNSQTVW
jgi:hypothetical protein